MIDIVPTKKGFGVEIKGISEDMEDLYQTVSKFWKDESYSKSKGYEDRNKIIGDFLIELRNACHVSKIDSGHYSSMISQLCFKISWVHIIFFINALRCNMNYVGKNVEDWKILQLFENLIERSMLSYDLIESKKLIPYLENGFNNGNEYLLFKYIDNSFFKLKDGRKAFRKLADMMRVCIYLSDEYDFFMKFLESEAKIHNCEIQDLQFDNETDNRKII